MGGAQGKNSKIKYQKHAPGLNRGQKHKSKVKNMGDDYQDNNLP